MRWDAQSMELQTLVLLNIWWGRGIFFYSKYEAHIYKKIRGLWQFYCVGLKDNTVRRSLVISSNDYIVQTFKLQVGIMTIIYQRAFWSSPSPCQKMSGVGRAIASICKRVGGDTTETQVQNACTAFFFGKIGVNPQLRAIKKLQT